MHFLPKNVMAVENAFVLLQLIQDVCMTDVHKYICDLYLETHRGKGGRGTDKCIHALSNDSNMIQLGIGIGTQMFSSHFILGKKRTSGDERWREGEQFFPITDKEKLLWRRRKKLLPITLGAIHK